MFVFFRLPLNRKQNAKIMKTIKILITKNNEYSFSWYLRIKELVFKKTIINDLDSISFEFEIETEETVSDFLSHYNTYMDAKASDRTPC